MWGAGGWDLLLKRPFLRISVACVVVADLGWRPRGINLYPGPFVVQRPIVCFSRCSHGQGCLHPLVGLAAWQWENLVEFENASTETSVKHKIAFLSFVIINGPRFILPKYNTNVDAVR